MYCHKFLGPAVNCLNYWGSSVRDGIEKTLQEQVNVCHQWKSFFWRWFVLGWNPLKKTLQIVLVHVHVPLSRQCVVFA